MDYKETHISFLYDDLVRVCSTAEKPLGDKHFTTRYDKNLLEVSMNISTFGLSE